MYSSEEPWRRPIEIPHLPPLACREQRTARKPEIDNREDARSSPRERRNSF
jgi:hypothetical protein